MFDFLLDAVNLQADYSIYLGILLGIFVQFICQLYIEPPFEKPYHTSSSMPIDHNKPFQSVKPITINKWMIWMIKITRRTENSNEEPDESISYQII